MFSSQLPTHLQRATELQQEPPKGKPYGVALPGTEKPGRSPVYRTWNSTKELVKTLDPNVATAHDIFESTAGRVPKSDCLGWRPYDPIVKAYGPYQWMDYETVQKRRTAFGAGLVELHQKHGCHRPGQYGIGLWSQNRPEWQLTDLACMSQSLYSVSIYDVLAADATEYIINHAELHCVVTSLPHIPTLLNLKPLLPGLKIIVSMDPLEAGEPAGLSKRALLESIAAGLEVSIYTIEEVEELGAFSKRTCNPPSPSDIVTINYTSGTTGNPKGVVLTHENTVAATSSGLVVTTQAPGDTLASYLPLAHIYARLSEHAAFWAGARIGYFHGNMLELVDDLKVLKPTGFMSVPRLFSRFGNVIRSATVDQPGFKGALSRHVVAAKTANLENPDASKATIKHAVYDRIWSKKVSAALGLERTRVMVSGSAPLDPTLHQFLRVATGTDIIQGYGLTETYAIACAQSPRDLTAGNCGRLAPCNEACLVSLPDMDYSVDDKPFPRGELLLRGGNIFREYYKNPEETANAMTEDGWFRTGDVCTIDDMGRIIIIDRRKNVLKLAQGEYISPERLEGVYLSELGYLAQGYVHGDSVQTFLVGIFGVQPESYAPWASKVLRRNIEVTDIDGIKSTLDEPQIRRAVLRDLDRVAKKHKLAGYEKIKNCALMLDPFTVENNLLTPTLKLKRPPAVKKYRHLLDDLYTTALAEEAAPKAKL
ncbi:putative AMP-binding enzyme [Aspergillus brunneoviolaceus CBS 621.78]|uniref:AMP-binding enzyme n=1 Tax=Aspergillus brunneoviolaceus CBS 621.78 TaxID=1450534 RepID=A0ACD1GH22_9EURO|nr:putative AMP-binding enzyme [Aspergillus brunneoviolaceus CBS 621.78]RAH48546.1 putative AMP-binding enzyme [Aspergillus brunneoviolaceus CBS 621.78]